MSDHQSPRTEQRPATVVASSPVVIARHSDGPPLLVRALWFVLIGWWLTGLVNVLAYLIALTIIGLPLAFMIFNRLPTVLTLRPRTVHTTHEVSGGVTHITETRVPQRGFFGRAVYFIFIGWWFGAIWSVLAWLLCITVIGIPVGVMMYNRLPAVMTLRRY
jgi:uncharacterized membrane protein YccF (DUF307 family)